MGMFIPAILFASAITVSSPDGGTAAVFTPEKTWSLSWKGTAVVEESRFGLDLDNEVWEKALGIRDVKQYGCWFDGLEFTGAETREVPDAPWRPLWGERAAVHNPHSAAVLHFERRDESRYRLDVEIRVYNGALAFRYFFPEHPAAVFHKVTADLTEYSLPEGTLCYAQRWAQAGHEIVTADRIEKPVERPLTLRLPSGKWASLLDADCDDWCLVKFTGEGRKIKSVMYSPVDLVTYAASPWKVVLLGDRPGDLLERNWVVEDLNPPCEVKDAAEWVKPGTIMRETTLTMQGATNTIDYCARHGIKYMLFDWKWYEPCTSHDGDATKVIDRLDMKSVVEYGRKKGVGIWLYVNQHALMKQADKLFPLLREWGIVGVKSGFVQYASHRWSVWLHGLVKKAAENRLMMNIHDEYRPNGFSRTYPNLLTQEGILGNEEFPSATHNTTLPFTRMLCGAADYTICWNDPRLTAVDKEHQMAAALVFYSPLTTLYWYDTPARAGEDARQKEWFDKLPGSWDETRVLDGFPGESITIARRKGDEWWIAVMTGDGKGLDVAIDTAELGCRPGRILRKKVGPASGATWRVKTGCKVADDPAPRAWRLCDELMMNRENPGRTNYVRGERFDHNGGEKAGCPTITMSAARGHVNGGNRAQAVNRSVMNKALKALDDGDELSAWEVLDTYLCGLAEMTPPVDLDHGHMQTLVGFQSFEVIHEDLCQEVAELYGRLKPYIDANCPEKRKVYDAALRKWADLIIANGVPDNNWDLIQARFIYAIAKVLPDADRKRYVDVVMNAREVRQWGLAALAAAGFDAATGIWNESPGYSVNVVNDFIDLAGELKENEGIDLFKEIPVLEKAVATLPEWTFPDGMLIGFGDTHPKAKFTPSKTPLFIAPNWLVRREGELAFALNGSEGNHQHANGISLETYAFGARRGVDAGIGFSLYGGADYNEYYSRFPAHNTVCVDGVSDYPVMKSHHAYEVVSTNGWGVTVRFLEPETNADQQRTVGIIDGKFFVDVFRSRRRDGKDAFHDYFYHNLGTDMALSVKTSPTEDLAFAGGHLYAYSYFWDKEAGDGSENVVAEWSDGMRLFMAGSDGRTVYKVKAPPTEGLSRMENQPYDLAKSPTFTFVARQQGEAWERPFVAVMDPSGTVEGISLDGDRLSVSMNDGSTRVLDVGAK
ncbi:MAG: glycoside hydrolase family 97 catalytic domain-containing protein [Kiritimatiellae bacterium]|nr:glycoside hydrolase family 97 catalytic domain-containing protein [Kiritimatiellia bacterium]